MKQSIKKIKIKYQTYVKLFTRLFILGIFVIILLAVISYSRGYRLNFNNRSLTSTGIVSIVSTPKASKVYVNGHLKGITDLNLNLHPDKYTVEIKKDGYTSWKKNFSLKGELVVSLNPLLFPLNASLSPLTNTGIVKAIPIDQTNKVLVFVQKPAEEDLENKNGIYIYDINKKTLGVFSSLSPVVYEMSIPVKVDFSQSQVILSPDFKQAIIEFTTIDEVKVNYLLSLDSENTDLFEVSQSKDSLTEAWDQQRLTINNKVLETFSKDIVKIASSSFEIIAFSPDETKVLYKAINDSAIPLIIKPSLVSYNQTPQTRNISTNSYYIYDKKEDRNYEIQNSKFKIQNSNVQWYYDSRHLIINEGKKIIVIDYDGTNSRVIYSGPYSSDFFTTTTNGRLVVLANLNPEANQWPDLYMVGIK